MLEIFTKRGRELNRDIKDCGKAEPGSQFFPEVQRLEKERREIINRVGGGVGVVLIAALAGASMLDDFYALRSIWGSKDPAPKPVPALMNRPEPVEIGPKVKRTEITDPVEVAKISRRNNEIKIVTNTVGIYLSEIAKELKSDKNFADLNLTIRELAKFYRDNASHPSTVTPETATGFIVMRMEIAGAEYFNTPSKVWLRDYRVPFYHREKRTLLYSEPDSKSLAAASEYDKLRLSFIWLALGDAWDDLADEKEKSGLEENIRLTAIAILGHDWMKDFMHTIVDLDRIDEAISTATNETLKRSLQVFKRSSGLFMTERQLLSLLLDILDGFMEQIAQAEGLTRTNDESYLRLAVYQALQIFLRMEGVLMENSESIPLLRRMPDLAKRVMENPEMIRR